MKEKAQTNSPNTSLYVPGRQGWQGPVISGPEVGDEEYTERGREGGCGEIKGTG